MKVNFNIPVKDSFKRNVEYNGNEITIKDLIKLFILTINSDKLDEVLIIGKLTDKFNSNEDELELTIDEAKFIQDTAVRINDINGLNKSQIYNLLNH